MNRTTDPRRIVALLAGLIMLNAATGAVLIAPQSIWSMRKGTAEASNPISAWRTPAFDITAWTAAPAPFHYGEGLAGGTPLNDMRYNYSCVFLRRTFAVADATAFDRLTLTAICDDGFVAWINGVEVARYNLPVGDRAHDTFAIAAVPEPVPWSEYSLPDPRSYLVSGDNLLAVQVFNNSLTSSDLRFDVELRGSAPDLDPPILVDVDPPPGTVTALTAITVTFSEPITGVDLDSLWINGFPLGTVSGTGATYTFAFTQPAYGPVAITWDPGHQISDLATPPNSFDHTAPGASWMYQLSDLVPPFVALLNPPPGVVLRALNGVEVTFNEPVTGIKATDLEINGLPASHLNGMGAGPYHFEFVSAPSGPVLLTWAGDHEIQDLAEPPNAFIGTNWDYRVDPTFHSAPLRITEFLASNRNPSGLRDEDGELVDWIEIHNPSDESVSLFGWALTDDPAQPGQWIFPAVALGPGGHLVVFASGKDRRPTTPDTPLHTNFKLSVSGEYLALFNQESPRVATTEFAPAYPEQRADHAYGLDLDGLWRYYSTPTPGAPNGTSPIGGVAPAVHFSVSRGLFHSPVELILSCSLPNAAIRYTLDGSEPTPSNGTTFSGPIVLDRTTVVRAAATAAHHLPSAVNTHTFIFPSSVLEQPADPVGYPANWITRGGISVPADYAMDPRVTGDPAYRERAQAAFHTLPTLVIATEAENLFSRQTGIYANPEGSGLAWERPASAEWIFPDGTGDGQIDCGLRIQGGTSREPRKTSKRSLRLLFKGDYGPSKLEADLFVDTPVRRFDTLVLDAGLNYVWHYNGGVAPEEQRTRAQYVRDQFISDLQNATGSPAPHGRWFHLYLNDLYWGIIGVHERPDETFAADYYGGAREAYDVLKLTTGFTVLQGDTTAWETLLSLADSGLADRAQYEQLQQYLDLTGFIDYLIVNFYAGNTDWPHHNWYAIRKRDASGRFRFPSWDAEHVMKSLDHNRTGVNHANTPGQIYDQLRRHSAEFRLRFADRVHRHFFNHGVLYVDPDQPNWNPEAPDRNRPAARYLERIAEIDPSLVLESARWGDSARPAQPYTPDVEWRAELDWLVSEFFPQRSALVLDQFRAIGLYPTGAQAPTFQQHGGRVQPGFELTMSAPAGTLYYTTDGTDPRLAYTGTVSATARPLTGPVLLHSNAVVKARTLNGEVWSALNEAAFDVGSVDLPLRITEIHYHPAEGDPYEFIEAQNVGSGPLDVGLFSFSGVTFIFPLGTVLDPGEVGVIAADLSPTAFRARYPEVHPLGYFLGSLNNTGERLALLDAAGRTIVSVRYQTGDGWPPAAAGAGASLEIIDPLGNPNDPANWQPSADLGGTPGYISSSPPLASMRLNEIMAHNLSAIPHHGTYPDWIELINTAAHPVDLGSWSLTDSGNPRKFVFPVGTIVPAGGRLVVWCDSRNDLPGIHTGFALSRDGEGIFLFDPQTNRVDALTLGLQLADLTVGRTPDATGDWNLCTATPGTPNQPQALAPPTSLVLNEWQPDPGSDNHPWIELHNRHLTLPAALRGLYLAIDDTVAELHALSFLPPEGFLRLVLDQQVGPDHLDLPLPQLGAHLVLYSESAIPLDTISYGHLDSGASEGRLPDGSPRIRVFPFTATPGTSNYLPLESARINEVLSHTDPPLEDAIELHNLTDAPLDLTGWYLSDDPGALTKFRMADGTLLPARGFTVIYEAQFNGGPGSIVPFSLNGAYGESLVLASADAAGNLDGYRHIVDFGPAAPGVSFGPYTTSASFDFVALLDRTFGVDQPSSVDEFRLGAGMANVPPRVGPVIINEIHYHPLTGTGPSTDEPHHEEYLELFNLSDAPIPLYDPDHPFNAWRIEDGVEFVLPPAMILPPRGYLLVAGFDPVREPALDAAFRIKYGIDPTVPILGPFEGRLNNAGERIALYRPDTPQPPDRPDAGYVPYLLIDQIAYKDQAPWPAAADGTGASLQRLAPSAYGNDPAHWRAASPTPGRANDSVAGPSIVVHFNSLTADLTLTWSATPGSRYLVQHHQEIQTSGWQDAGMLTATDHVLSFTEINPVVGSYRFYRVLRID